MRDKITAVLVGVTAFGAVGGVATASTHHGQKAAGDAKTASAAQASSRLDDGQELLGQSKITEQQAITAAQDASQGDLNEVDLEQYSGKLVWNVDTGVEDVKVDASNAKVLAVTQDDTSAG